MLWNVLITAVCVFVILRRTRKVWLASGVFALVYFFIWLIIGGGIIPKMFLKVAVYFAYSFVFFYILKRINFEDNPAAFVLAFVAGTLIHTFIIG